MVIKEVAGNILISGSKTNLFNFKEE